ncbi:MAG: Mu transposase C-terminal domain-containing protein, partial [Chlorobium sp.]|nr:Mu transposase C-terminal domain-containing protein [Chlorobium sp.]
TPYEELAHRINQGWDPQSVQLDGEMLGHLFMPHERIKIARCEFRLHGNLYHAYELQTHHGEDMIAAYDIHDANHVWILNQDEQLVCKATWNGNNIHGVPVSKMEQADFERTDRRIKLKERQLEMIKSEAQPNVVIPQPADRRDETGSGRPRQNRNPVIAANRGARHRRLQDPHRGQGKIPVVVPVGWLDRRRCGSFRARIQVL